jgi:hypothetical protein
MVEAWNNVLEERNVVSLFDRSAAEPVRAGHRA